MMTVSNPSDKKQPGLPGRLQGGYGLPTDSPRPDVDLSQPLISIITVVRNGSATLEHTIKSVLGQTYPNIEYIIIDGASTDETVNIIRKYESQIAYWISEKDKGIFDAMNKGIDSKHGDWVLFLGANDKFHNPDVIKTALQSASENNAILYGNTLYSNGSLFRSSFDQRMLLHNKLQHQAVFYRKDALEEFHYDTAFKINADYELNLCLYLKKTQAHYLNFIVADCDYGGVSTDLKLRRFAIRELNLIRSRHVSPILNAVLTGILNIRLVIRLALSRFST